MSPSVGLGAIRARGVINELHIRRPAELVIEAIAWHYRVRVQMTPLDGAEACIVRRGDRGTIIIRAGLDPGKYRFSLAHELGHFLIHPDIALKPAPSPILPPGLRGQRSNAKPTTSRQISSYRRSLL